MRRVKITIDPDKLTDHDFDSIAASYPGELHMFDVPRYRDQQHLGREVEGWASPR